MRQTLFAGFLVLAGMLLTSPCQAQQAGDTVVVISEKANIQLGEKVVDIAYRGAILLVRKVHEEWLSVSQGTPGWIYKDDVMLLGPAADRFSAIIREDPKAAFAYFVRGNIQSEQGEFTKAIADYTKAIQLDSQDGAFHNGRGFAWRNLGELDKAIADYNQALQLNPKDPWAYNNRGIAWHDKGEFDKAIADYNQAVRLDANHTYAYLNRGNAWASKGEYAKSIADYNKAIALDSKDLDMYLNRGLAWQSQAEYARALADFSTAVELEPKRAQGYNYRAWLWAACPDGAIRDGKKALASANRACELTGWKDANMINTLAAASAEAGDFDAAVRWQARALEIAGKNAPQDFRARLELYRAGKPFRLMVKTR